MTILTIILIFATYFLKIILDNDICTKSNREVTKITVYPSICQR